MNDLKWLFPSNNGGRETGMHDPGVETFKGNFTHYLARELIQNSFDARDEQNQPVTVKFDYIELARSEIPDMDTLTDSLHRCATYWNELPKSQKFFRDSEKLSQATKIPALVVGDYNTKGVCGSDKDRKGDWYNLIRCAGSSAKGAGAGGSFGIGKNAPFAASPLRTVLYSTYTADGQRVFQGVSILTSFEMHDGNIAQATGYLGDEGASVRDPKQIPKLFLRDKKGTDIVVLGYPGGEKWQSELLFSVLDNFWLAILWGELIVQVGNLTADKDSLKDLLEQFSREDGFTGHLYYKTYTQGTKFPGTLQHLKAVEMSLLEGDDELPKRVSLSRNTGMTIERKRFNSLKPYCGVFVCRNAEGSDKLRGMEPPKHDSWDPDHPEKGQNKKIEAEYVSFIRECIKSLSPVDDSQVIAVPGLHQYLPDDEDSPEEPFGDGGDEAGRAEASNARYETQKVEGHAMKSTHTSMQPDSNKPGEGDEETEDAGGEEGGAGPTDGSNDGDDGMPGGGGGEGDGKGSLRPGSGGGKTSKPAVPVNARTFCTNANTGAYTFSLKSDVTTRQRAHIAVFGVGDDQKTPVGVKSASTEAGKALEVDAQGIIGPVDLPKAKPLILHVVLTEPIRMAMEVLAYEGE